MGFLDKVKAQAEQAVKQGQDKLEDVQAKKKADGLLRDLGAWYYAGQTDRDNGQASAELARITAELQAHEAEHGPLGGRADDDEPEAAAPAPPAPDGAPAPAAPAPPVSSPPPVSAPPTSPPPTSPPPPVGSVPPPPPGAPPAPPAPPTSTF